MKLSLNRHEIVKPATPLPPRSGPKQGFALIVTLSLMMLLTLLAMGMLSLSSIALRGAARDVAQAEARANARVALNLALGQLQQHAGDDRRVTWTADMIPTGDDFSRSAAVAGRRHWTGVHRSWDVSLDQRPEPEFLAWLVSGPPDAAADVSEPTRGGSAGDSVRLVGAGTAGADADARIEVPAVPLRGSGSGTARLAWWTGDQGVKAMLGRSSDGPATDPAAVRNRLLAAPVHAVELARDGHAAPFAAMDKRDRRLRALTSWPQSEHHTGDAAGPRSLFHDLAPYSGGLLANVRGGGFRRDLSFLYERAPATDAADPLYSIGSDYGINHEELLNFYLLSRELEDLGGTSYTTGGTIPQGTRGLIMKPNAVEAKADPFHHFKHPVIVSCQSVYSLKTVPVGTAPNQVDRVHLVVDPIVTLWNPHDVPLVVPASIFFTVIHFAFPYSIVIELNGETYPCPTVTLTGSTLSRNTDTNQTGLRIADLDRLVFKPGEVIKYSQAADMQLAGNQNVRHLQGRAGFNYGGGLARPLRDHHGRHIDLQDGDRFTYTLEPNGYTVGQTSTSGRSITGGNLHSRHFGTHMAMYSIGVHTGLATVENETAVIGGYTIDGDFGNERAQRDQPRMHNTPGTKPADERIYADRPQYADVFPTFGTYATRPLTVEQLRVDKAPVLMHSVQVKTETASLTGTRTLQRFNPRAHLFDFYDLSPYERDLLPYEIVVEPLNSWINRKLETSINGNAFFGGGYDAADGNSLVATHSVPRQPIHSLAAFQHSTANGFLMQQLPTTGYANLMSRTPMLPQISHAIGNSFAPAVLAADETSRVLPNGGRPVADHSWLANQALWDDFVFSSAAPQTAKEGYQTPRSQRQVVEQFLGGSSPLPIARYQPNPGPRTVDEIITRLFDGQQARSEAADLMTSLIRVEGMFNVNSTSVQAWRVLLASLIDEDIVTHDPLGTESRTQPGEGVPVVGLNTPTDQVSPGEGLVPAREAAQWNGRRMLTEEQITLLAEAIVSEVRRRGPFLSLADFVNRRVTGDDAHLAQAGAVQSALDSAEINRPYSRNARAVDAAVSSRMAFPEAEAGAKSTGMPGIVKQADILTPLAPILSARSDTFLIRAYGEVRDADGAVVGRAWCEALVERGPDFVSGTQPPETMLADLTHMADQAHGRRFNILSFRWLDPEEL